MNASLPHRAPTLPARRIWLCADDYGMAPGVNTAIRDLVATGRLNATSVMVGAPSFDRAEAAALDELNGERKRVAIGLHVTLTGPFEPLTSNFRPLDNGAFLPLAATLRAALLRRFDVTQVRSEVAAQMQAFIAAFGRQPDFVDGHQHVQLFPQIRDAVLDVARNDAPDAWVRQCGRVRLPWPQRVRDRKGLLLDILSLNFRRRAAARGIRTNTAFAGTYDFSTTINFAELFPRFLDGLPDGSLVMCHPGFVDAELTRLDPLTTQREQEYAFFAGQAFPAVLSGQGVALH